MRGIWKIGASGKDALRRGFIALLATFAIGLHAFVVETHIDGLPAPAAIAATQAGVANATNTKLTPLPAHKAPCLFCQEQARAGAFLQASPPVLALAERVHVSAIEPAAADAIRIPAHPWQSRAPPTLL